MRPDKTDQIRLAINESRRIGWAARIRSAMAIDDYAERQAILEDIARDIHLERS